MITESFIFLPSIGRKMEQKLWAKGVSHWDDFLSKDNIAGIGAKRKAQLDNSLGLWRKQYEQKDPRWLACNLARREHFRLWNEFKDNVLYLDIETTEYYGDITVVGLYDGEDCKSFVRGCNLDRDVLLEIFRQHKLLVTFNGASFDIPILERFLGEKILLPHIDLRQVCAKTGYAAPLKVVEEMLGIEREHETAGIRGDDAISLWYLWRNTGKQKYLEQLLAYNMADVVNLEPIANHTIPLLWKKVKESV